MIGHVFVFKMATKICNLHVHWYADEAGMYHDSS